MNLFDRNELVRRYGKYLTAKQKVKARQREELKRELAPFAYDVGEAVVSRQQQGDSVDTILFTLGPKNKTLVYEFIATFRTTPEPIVNTDSDADADTITDTADDYTIDGTFVHFGETESYELVKSVDGGYEPPDAWATHSKERRAVYKKILGELNAA